MTIRVLIAEDHCVVREGLRRLLGEQEDIHVVDAVGDGVEVLGRAAQLKPDVVLMDLSMPRLDGAAATRALLAKNPEARVLILSMHDTPDAIRGALEAGASGYVTKDSCTEEVVDALRSTAAGRKYFSRSVSQQLPQAQRAAGASAPELERITATERQILSLVAEGLSNAEIGKALHLSARTVETYRGRMMHKLGLENVPALVRFAIRHHLTALE
jgi:DNA-binding NarL/FixJ family response regulator